jgi:flagellar basal body-associated protein FliL
VLIETEPNERREGVLKILLESALAIFLSSSATLVMLLVSRFLAVKCIAF